MNWGENTKIQAIFCVLGFLFILVGLILMHNNYDIWSYEIIIMGVVFLLLGIDASRKPTD